MGEEIRLKTLVVGAGAAGLACAYDLTRSGADAILLEATDRLGGKIRSESRGGLVFECGPDSFLTTKPEALELARELGLESLLLGTHPTDKDVFVYTRGALRRFPEGLMLMAPSKPIAFLSSNLMSVPARLRMGLELLVPRGDAEKDESIGEFTRRRFGAEALEVLAGPVMAGIYAGDPDRLSLESTFPQFRDMERRSGSVLRALLGRPPLPPASSPGHPKISMFATLRGGLGELARALAGRIAAGSVRLGARLSSLRAEGPGYRARLESGQELEADCVVLALGADAAAPPLAALDEGLAAELEGIRFASTATVSLAFPERSLPPSVRGFGFVVDRREGLSLSAATFSSLKFPGRFPEGTGVIRCFLGGDGREEALAGPDASLAERALADLGRILGLRERPMEQQVYRWPRANPQYDVGHSARLARLEALLRRHPGLVLAGSSYRGVGIPDCVRSGRQAARRLLAARGRPEGFIA